MHRKLALEIVATPDDGFIPGLSAGISDTVGRVNALPAAVLLGQEKAFDWLKGPNKAELEKEIKSLKKDRRLKNTLVRLGHADLIDDYKRLYNLPQNNILDKALGTVMLPLGLIGPTLNRADHYNPLTDVATIYSGVPEVVHHELGHARDFNTKRKLIPKTLRTLLPGIENSILHLIPGITQAQIAGPATQYLESRANEEAEAGYKKNKKEFRRRLWPARGTYWAGLASVAALLHPEIRKKALEFVTNPDDSAAKQTMKAMALGLIPLAAGAIGGRTVAEIRNALPDAD